MVKEQEIIQIKYLQVECSLQNEAMEKQTISQFRQIVWGENEK